MSEVQNQLNSQNYATVIVDAFNNVGGRVFPDQPATIDINDLNRIVKGWQSTHVPTYGAPLPNNGTEFIAVGTTVGDAVTLVEAQDNEVILVSAISFENIDSGAIELQVKLGNTLVEIASVAGNASSPSAATTLPIYVSKGQKMTITVTSGTANRMNVTASGVYCSH